MTDPHGRDLELSSEALELGLLFASNARNHPSRPLAKQERRDLHVVSVRVDAWQFKVGAQQREADVIDPFKNSRGLLGVSSLGIGAVETALGKCYRQATVGTIVGAVQQSVGRGGDQQPLQTGLQAEVQTGHRPGRLS